ncbi:hypothetical protein ACNKHM_05435 [Shigella sonnei]
MLLITHDIEEAGPWRLNWFCFHPAQARALERLPLNFARRFVAGESSPASSPIHNSSRCAKHVLSRVFEQREAFS